MKLKLKNRFYRYVIGFVSGTIFVKMVVIDHDWSWTPTLLLLIFISLVGRDSET